MIIIAIMICIPTKIFRFFPSNVSKRDATALQELLKSPKRRHKSNSFMRIYSGREDQFVLDPRDDLDLRCRQVFCNLFCSLILII